MVSSEVEQRKHLKEQNNIKKLKEINRIRGRNNQTKYEYKSAKRMKLAETITFESNRCEFAPKNTAIPTPSRGGTETEIKNKSNLKDTCKNLDLMRIILENVVRIVTDKASKCTTSVSSHGFQTRISSFSMPREGKNLKSEVSKIQNVNEVDEFSNSLSESEELVKHGQHTNVTSQGTEEVFNITGPSLVHEQAYVSIDHEYRPSPLGTLGVEVLEPGTADLPSSSQVPYQSIFDRAAVVPDQQEEKVDYKKNNE